MIKQTGMEFTRTPTELNTRGTGKTIYSMVMERRYGLMGLSTKVNISKARSTGEGSMCGLMAVHMMETGLITKLKVTENIYGSMEDSMRASGSLITCTVMAYIHGKTEEDMRANTKPTRNMVREFMFGQTAVDTKAVGLMGSSTVKVNTSCQMELLNKESGSMGKDSSGLMMIALILTTTAICEVFVFP